MTCPHSVIDHDPLTDEYFCVKCGDVVEEDLENWDVI